MPFDMHPACADVQITSRAGSEVTVVPRRKKVAIVGFASNTLHLVPWFDPEFEIWSLNQGHMHCARRTDRHFEMHQPEATADVRDPDYLTFLKTLTIPVYMIQQFEEYPTSLRYPIEDAIQYVGMDYFTSSIAYMLVLAAMENFEEIHIYGVNLAIGDEYFYEKPNAEFLIGLLRGRGIKVYVPQASALLKMYRRYGYHVDARPAASWKALMTGRINEYKARLERIQADGNVILGAMREAEALCQIGEGMDAGADIVLVPPPVKPPTSS
jgi:hypothetical protein